MTTKSKSPAQATLHPKSRPHDEADVERAIEIFKNMNAAQKRRHLEFLKSMNGSNVNQEEVIDWPTVAEFLSENEMQERVESTLSEIGLTEDALQKVSSLFFQAVEERLSHDPFRQALAELLADYSPSPFISDEQINVVEMLARKIEELQDDIDYIEQENATLVEEITQNLTEESQYSKPERARRRSTINEYMMEADSDNEDALFNANHQQHNAQMASYLRAMGEDFND